MVTEGTGWDFFVSYTQADRAWAEWIAWILEENSYRVRVQAWDFVPGSNWTHSMDEGVAGADRTIAVLSEAYLASVYGKAEWLAAWAQDPLGEQRKLLAIRVSDCPRPGLLSNVVGFDLFGLEKEKARARLLEMTAAAIKGRRKPVEDPPFPGHSRAIPSRAKFPGDLPSVLKVPARHPNFTGRTTLLNELEESLTNSSPVVTVKSLHGMGGVGKTQLATEYAHQKASRYDVVWWMDVEEPTTIPDQFAALAAELGLDIPPEPDVLQAYVGQALSKTGSWLLVFDNADTAESIRPWLPTAPMPAGRSGHAIATTRRGSFRALGQVIEVDTLDPPEALDLMRTRVPGLDPKVGATIAEELGYLPLGLEQAAAYMDHTGMLAADYLELLRARTAEMLEKGQIASSRNTVATVWTLSLDRLQNENLAARQLLDICAYFAPESIPLDLFTDHPDLLPAPLSDVVADTLRFTDVLGAVVDYSLAKRTPSGLQIHRLIQAALRAMHLDRTLPTPTTPDDAP
ncbi:FxSxx-COOH system tetratricopeptide repeat protein [Kribbella sp. NPDC051770]|uniref:FxSxx-COOH system tetratricopeptide repeat protein n=1 Tax=Kribbella sp. NPDC051770 TaxID=3155413 RepID=UPI00344893A1